MKTIFKLSTLSAAVLTAASAFAQSPGPQAPVYQERPLQQAAYQDRAQLPQQELDSILAPIALYPDTLLSQLLMAATYPQDVVQAAQWSRSNPQLKGDEAVRAVENQPWDPSVKSMVAFPDVLKAMADQPQWIERLGVAFLGQEEAVMQTVQQLRSRADGAGNLQSSEQLAVQRSGDDYVLASPSPETTYVPYYDPRVVYGTWQSDYQPVYWNPWPGYAYYPSIGFGWGSGIYVGAGFFYGGFDWGHRYVRYSGHRPYYYTNNNYWRGWRDYRNGGRHYANDRSPGRGSYNGGRYNGNGNGRQDRPQYGNDGRYSGRGDRPATNSNNTNHYNPSMRQAAPRYGTEGSLSTGSRVRPQQVQQGQSQPTRVQSTQQQGIPVRGESVGQRYVPLAPASGASVGGAGAQQRSASKPMRVAPSAQPQQQVQRAAPQQQVQRAAPSQQVQHAAQPRPMQAAQPVQRSSNNERGGGNRGGGNGGRGQER